MKKVDFQFQEELQEHIKTLNSLYKVIMEQKSMLENNDFENLYTNRSKFNEIARIVTRDRQKLDIMENVADEAAENHILEINGLINQMSDLMHQIIEIEEHNSSIMQISQHKLIQTNED